MHLDGRIKGSDASSSSIGVVCEEVQRKSKLNKIVQRNTLVSHCGEF